MHVVEQDGNTEHRERPPHIQSRMDSCNRGRVDCHTRGKQRSRSPRHCCDERWWGCRSCTPRAFQNIVFLLEALWKPRIMCDNRQKEVWCGARSSLYIQDKWTVKMYWKAKTTAYYCGFTKRLIYQYCMLLYLKHCLVCLNATVIHIFK